MSAGNLTEGFGGPVVAGANGPAMPSIDVEALSDRLAFLPDVMRSAPRWLLWTRAKVPHYASGRRRHGTLDGGEDVAQLVALDEALDALDARYAGVGFALGFDAAHGLHWQGLDLDDALDGAGQFTTQRARELYESTDGYAERSPSGHGLHVIGLGAPFRALAWKRDGEQAVELYSKQRYFTVTGWMMRDGAPEDMAPLAERVRAGLVAAGKTREHKAREHANDSRAYFDRMPPNLREWIEAHPIEAALMEHGYQQIGDRWLSPRSESGVPGIVMLDEFRACTFHASDAGIGTPTNGADAEVFNALDCEVRYRFGGDRKRALRNLLPERAQEPAGGDAIRAEHESWPDPRPIVSELPPAPEFDAPALLPEPLAGYVLDEADRMPCPPDYIAAALIVGAGAVIGSRCALKPKRCDDWITTPNLFGGVVGDPASKKSPGIDKGLRFLERLEAEEAERLKNRKAEYGAELAAHKAREAAIASIMKKAAGENGKPEDPAAMATAIHDLKSLVPPEEPRARRFRTNDATVEKIGDILAKCPDGVLVFRDELVGLLSSWERDGREGDRAFYLEGWNGTGSFAIDRIGRGSLFVPTLNLSVFGGIQPDLLGRYLASIVESNDNDGRIQRFQVLVYPEPIEWQWRDRYPVRGAREHVRDMFLRLAAFNPVEDGATPADDFVKIPHFGFDDAAQEIFIAWSHDLHHQLIPAAETALLRQHFAKYEKLFCALALILHLAEGRIGPVGEDAAIRAASWAEYLAGHARRVYGLLDDQKVTAAQTLAHRIATGKLLDGFTVRDVYRKGWAGLKTLADVEAALNLLEEHAHVAGYEDDGPGRPTTRYCINPKLSRGPAR